MFGTLVQCHHCDGACLRVVACTHYPFFSWAFLHVLFERQQENHNIRHPPLPSGGPQRGVKIRHAKVSILALISSPGPRP